MLAELRFKFVYDMYELVGFKNILSKKELSEEYLAGLPHFCQKDNNPGCIEIFDKDICNKLLSLLPVHNGSDEGVCIRVGFYITKSELSVLVAIMKRAGQRLTDINKKSKEIIITI